MLMVEDDTAAPIDVAGVAGVEILPTPAGRDTAARLGRLSGV
jgi:hypothetical protein